MHCTSGTTPGRAATPKPGALSGGPQLAWPGRVAVAALTVFFRWFGGEHAADAVCTALYATVDVNGSTARLTLSSGGHPLPLILRANGSVEQFGEPGTLLGIAAKPALADHTSNLRAGEAVLFYTDGLLDAYAPGRVAQSSDLESILRSCAGRVPSEIIAAIEDSLLSSGDTEPRDDVAIVVLRMAP